MQVFKTRYAAEPLECRGLLAPLPGLAITHNPITGLYSLTHVRSGNAVVVAESPEPLAAAFPLLASVDWTRHGEDLAADAEARALASASYRLPGCAMPKAPNQTRADI